jgi:hypothetical protein
MINNKYIFLFLLIIFLTSGCGSLPITASIQEGEILGSRVAQLFLINQGRTKYIFDNEVTPILNSLQEGKVYNQDSLYRIFGDRNALIYLPGIKKYVLKSYLEELSASFDTGTEQIKFLYFGYVDDELVVVRYILQFDGGDHLVRIKEFPDLKRESYPPGEKWMADIGLLMFSPDKWLRQVLNFNAKYFATEEQFLQTQQKLFSLSAGIEWDSFLREINGIYYQIADEMIAFLPGGLTGCHDITRARERRVGFGFVDDGKEILKLMAVFKEGILDRKVKIIVSELSKSL